MTRVSHAHSPSFIGHKLNLFLALFLGLLHNSFFSSWWIRQMGTYIVRSESRLSRRSSSLSSWNCLIPFSKLPMREVFPRTASMYAGNQFHKGLVLGLAPRAKARKTGFDSMISELVRLRSPDLQPSQQQVRQSQYYNGINATSWRTTYYEIGTPP